MGDGAARRPRVSLDESPEDNGESRVGRLRSIFDDGAFVSPRGLGPWPAPSGAASNRTRPFCPPNRSVDRLPDVAADAPPKDQREAVKRLKRAADKMEAFAAEVAAVFEPSGPIGVLTATMEHAFQRLELRLDDLAGRPSMGGTIAREESFGWQSVVSQEVSLGRRQTHDYRLGVVGPVDVMGGLGVEETPSGQPVGRRSSGMGRMPSDSPTGRQTLRMPADSLTGRHTLSMASESLSSSRCLGPLRVPRSEMPQTLASMSCSTVEEGEYPPTEVSASFDAGELTSAGLGSATGAADSRQVGVFGCVSDVRSVGRSPLLGDRTQLGRPIESTVASFEVEIPHASSRVMVGESESCLVRLVTSSTFELVSLCVICLNLVFVVCRIDFEARHMVVESALWMVIMERCFTILYLLEVLLKLWAFGWKFFTMPSRVWNIVDVVFVAGGIVEMVEGKRHDVFIARGVRMVKFVRTARIFKFFHFVRELRTMVVVVLSTFSTLLWAVVFLLSALLFFSLYFVETMTAYRGEAGAEQEEVVSLIAERFGDVPRAMLTMTMSNFGGIDWHEVFDVLVLDGVVTGVIWVFTVLGFHLALLNVITSIFVDRAIQLGAPEEEEIIDEQVRKEVADREQLLEFIKRLFDIAESGRVTLEELQRQLQKPDVRKYFELHGLKIRDIKLFFQTLTAFYSTDEIHVDAFVDGCMKVRGSASSLDMQALKLQTQLLTDVLVQISVRLGMSKEPEPWGPNAMTPSPSGSLATSGTGTSRRLSSRS